MAHDEAYHKAEREIGAAQRSGIKELDLDDLGLTELPDSLGQLTHLKSLHLSGNQLAALPKVLGQLPQLQALYLSRNQLTSLPEPLCEFIQLQSLVLSGNRLTSLPESLGQLTRLQSLGLSKNRLTSLPEALGQLTRLQTLGLSENQLMSLPKSLGNLTQLQSLNLSMNQLTSLPKSLGDLTQLQSLNLSMNQLTSLPKSLGNLTQLQSLNLSMNRLTSLPESLGYLTQLQSLNLSTNTLPSLPNTLDQLTKLEELNLLGNPLNPEMAAAYIDGLSSVMAYLRAKAAAQITLNEAKLILVGEGEVGKTCLLDALLGDPWKEHDTTHGIEIKQIKVTIPERSKEITLNGWDFGGQRVYRPTHQLFFSAPAVYLVVWKPREGPQQGFVREWIKLIKHREPEARILVVATHGGPQQRQPDIDRQELWDLFGKDTVTGFFFVESKPDESGYRKGILKLKSAIASVASTLPEMGRSVPKRWQEAREALEQTEAAYLPLERVLDLCRSLQMDDEEARLFVAVEHRLGHLIHYQYDPTLRDIVVLKPDWLATAISYVLDDEVTRQAHGLTHFSHLSDLWNDPARPASSRYPANLHPIFRRLMERFDLSYRVADPSPKNEADPQSLVALLVPDNRSENLSRAWPSYPSAGDIQQVQICRIVDDKGQSAAAEGLFYQLIVRLHRYSLGRVNYSESVHWQRGLLLDDDYNGRAMLEHVGNDVRITVRAPYPERFLAMLTGEVKYLVESFWEGLRCNVMVPCIEPCGKETPGLGLYEVEKLIASKRHGRPEFPCPVCNEWQDIDSLLRNAPAAQPASLEIIQAEFSEVKRGLAVIYQKMLTGQAEARGSLIQLNRNDQILLSRIDDSFAALMHALSDEAKEGPRLFSLAPVERDRFDPRRWVSARFRLTLWCEHSRLPLPVLNKDGKTGVYEFDITRRWVKEAAPLLKALTITLRTLLPVAFSALNLLTDESIYKAVEDELDFSQECFNALVTGSEEISKLFVGEDAIKQTSPGLLGGAGVPAHGATLRQFHALLKKQDPNGKYGNLVRVMNKRQEFLWVHPQFEKEY